MSIYVNSYMTKAKKFEATASQGKNGIVLEINVYDSIKLEMTPEQWETCITEVNKFLKKGVGRPAPKADDDY